MSLLSRAFTLLQSSYLARIWGTGICILTVLCIYCVQIVFIESIAVERYLVPPFPCLRAASGKLLQFQAPSQICLAYRMELAASLRSFHRLST